jgi:hypothetical protein
VAPCYVTFFAPTPACRSCQVGAHQSVAAQAAVGGWDLARPIRKRRHGCSGGGRYGTLGVLGGGGRLALWCCTRRCQACCRTRSTICGQASAHRSLQATVRKATIRLTWARAQCIPAPFSRRSTTSLLALDHLEMLLFLRPVADIAPINPDREGTIRDRKGGQSAGHPSTKAHCSSPSSSSQRCATMKV